MLVTYVNSLLILVNNVNSLPSLTAIGGAIWGGSTLR